MKLGVTLPTFTASGGPALAAARVAEEGGLDGVFVFDHLWPMGNPGRPALWSFGVLGAVAAATARVTVAPFVARVGLLAADDLVGAVRALVAIAGPDRVIAAVGVGDALSAAENLAYGVDYPPAATRLAEAGRVLDRLAALGVTTWMGGNSGEAGAVAAAHRAGRNLWNATRAQIANARDGHVPQVSWGGQVLIGRSQGELRELRDRHGERPGLISGTVAEVAERLLAMSADWCVCAPLDYLVQPARATETVCLVAEAVR